MYLVDHVESESLQDTYSDNLQGFCPTSVHLSSKLDDVFSWFCISQSFAFGVRKKRKALYS